MDGKGIGKCMRTDMVRMWEKGNRMEKGKGIRKGKLLDQACFEQRLLGIFKKVI